MTNQLHYLLRRAEQETVRAVIASDPRAEAAHRAMSRDYSRRAVAALRGEYC